MQDSSAAGEMLKGVLEVLWRFFGPLVFMHYNEQYVYLSVLFSLVCLAATYAWAKWAKLAFFAGPRVDKGVVLIGIFVSLPLGFFLGLWMFWEILGVIWGLIPAPFGWGFLKTAARWLIMLIVPIIIFIGALKYIFWHPVEVGKKAYGILGAVKDYFKKSWNNPELAPFFVFLGAMGLNYVINHKEWSNAETPVPYWPSILIIIFGLLAAVLHFGFYKQVQGFAKGVDENGRWRCIHRKKVYAEENGKPVRDKKTGKRHKIKVCGTWNESTSPTCTECGGKNLHFIPECNGLKDGNKCGYKGKDGKGLRRNPPGSLTICPNCGERHRPIPVATQDLAEELFGGAVKPKATPSAPEQSPQQPPAAPPQAEQLVCPHCRTPGTSAYGPFCKNCGGLLAAGPVAPPIPDLELNAQVRVNAASNSTTTRTRISAASSEPTAEVDFSVHQVDSCYRPRKRRGAK